MAFNMRYLKNDIGLSLLWICGLLTIFFLVVITIYVLWNGLPIIFWNGKPTPNLSFLTDEPMQSGKTGGIFPIIVNTVLMTFMAMIIATPFSIGGAIYMAEYAGENVVTRLVRFSADSLAGIPSIVIGLFGYLLFVWYLHFGFSLLAGSLSVSIMALPIILRVAEEAIKVVPKSYKEGSLALGVTKWQTIYRVVLPAAIPGIITGLILGMGRIIGETAVFMLTAGSSMDIPDPFPLLTSKTYVLGGFLPSITVPIPSFLLDSIRVMTVHQYIISMENVSLPNAFGTAATLLIMVYAITVTSNYITKRYTLKLGGRR